MILGVNRGCMWPAVIPLLFDEPGIIESVGIGDVVG